MKKNLLQPPKDLAVAIFSFIIVFVYAVVASSLFSFDPITETINNFSITDIYYRMMQTEDGSCYLTIVKMDSLRNRGDIARVLEEIEKCGPKVIGVDITFEYEKCDTLSDNALRSVAERHSNLVFTYELFDEHEDENIGYTQSKHSFFADGTPIHEGVCDMPRDNLYSIKRTLRLGWMLNGKKVPSFVGEIVNLYTEGDFAVATDDDLKINFTPTCFKELTPSEILQNKQLIDNRIVLLGSMTDGNDMHYTPRGKMAGVELQAYAIQTLLERSQIKEMPVWIEVAISVFLVMLTNMLQLLYLKWTSKSRSPMVYHVMGSTYMLGWVTFLWAALIMWVTFICFCRYKVSLELEWAIAAMAFLATSRSFYAACEDYYKQWKDGISRA